MQNPEISPTENSTPEHLKELLANAVHKLALLQRRISLTADINLIVAYHAAKALSESLSTVDQQDTRFTDVERAVIFEARKHAVAAFGCLNDIVSDDGNALGRDRWAKKND